MAENKYVLKALSTYTGKENTLYQKEFDTRERAEMYRDILEPVLKKAQADNPVLPYVTYIIEELPEGLYHGKETNRLCTSKNNRTAQNVGSVR